MLLYLRYRAKPNGVEQVQISINADIPVVIQLDDVKVTIVKDEYAFLLEQQIQLDESEVDELRNKNQFYEHGTTAYRLAEYLFEKAKMIVEYIKFFYGIPELDKNFTSQGLPEWSIDEKEWFVIPMKYRSKWIPSGPIYYLPPSLIEWFPILMKHGIRPFFAFNHLHKAFNEKDTRHQWINATISAELAFKEFLSVYDSKCASLITYAPTPPLDILYNQVLKEQTGEASPYSQQLISGASTRNKLIHRPNFKSPDKQATTEYLYMVQSAILHLQYLLYKEIPLFKHLFEKSVSDYENNKKNSK